MNKTLIIYHSADFDGIFSREIFKLFYKDNADYLGWDYGQPVPDTEGYDHLFMVDISIEELMDDPRLVWIDHHISAINKYNKEVPGLRIDGVAACRLAYQYLFGKRDATKEDYVNRKVVEPECVRLAGEYDIWDKRDPDAEVFQLGLKSEEVRWDHLLNDFSGTYYTQNILNKGKAVQYYVENRNKEIAERIAFTMEFDGKLFLAMNTQGNSLVFDSLNQEGYDGLLLFYYTGDKWKVSMYHTKHKTDIDLSEIAVKYGGGGHRGACGFESDHMCRFTK